MRVVRTLAILLVSQAVVSGQTGSAVVQGMVVKAVTNVPISNASVEMRSIDAGAARIYTGTTDGAGRFAFRNVAPGRYQLTPIRAGYVRGDFGLRGPGASGVAIVLAAGQRMLDLRLAMIGTGTIAGRITDPLGEGIGNVHVKALRLSYQDGHAALIAVKSVFTNDLGEFRLGWLPPGRYNISALHPDASVNPLNLPEVINSATIVGTAITNAGGMNGGSFGASGNRDPAVRSRLGLAPGEEYVPVYYPGSFDQRSASVIDVAAEAELTGYDLIVSPARMGSITGTVTGLPSPAGAPTRVMLQLSRDPSYTLRTSGVTVDAQTGSFSLTGLAPGAYVLAAAAGNGDQRVSGRTRVEVAEGGAEHVQVALEPGVKIPVSVTIAGSASTARPSNLRVSLRTDPVIPGIADTPAAALSADGSGVLSAVVAGTYIVNVAPLMTLSRATPTNPPPAVPGPAFASSLPAPAVGLAPRLPAGFAAPTEPGSPSTYVQSIRLGDRDILNGGLRVDGRTFDQPLEIVIGTNPGRLDGVVTDGQRRPVGHAVVLLAPDSTKERRMDLYRTTSSDPAGRFRFQSLPPEDYRVFAWEDVESGAWLDPRFLQEHDGRAQRVRVAGGVSVAVEVTVVSQSP